MNAGVVTQIGMAVRSYRVGHVTGVELVDDGLGLRDMHACAGAGPVTMDQRGQSADRGDPADHMVGKDGGRVVEPVPGAVG